MSKLSDEELIQILASIENPNVRDMRVKNGYPSEWQYRQRFGSWRKALELAGHTPKTRDLTDSELLRILHEAGQITKDKCIPANNMPHFTMYIRRFGQWNRALELAGLDRNTWVGGLKDDAVTLVYLIYFYQEDLYKIGITQRTIKERFSGYPPYEVVLYIDDLNLDEARSLEKTWLNNVKPLRHDAVSFSGGHTECFKYL